LKINNVSQYEMDQREIKLLIEKRIPLLNGKKYLWKILEFIDFLHLNSEEKELESFCIEELLKPVIIEFIIGREIYSIEEYIGFFKKHKFIVERELHKEILSSRMGIDLNRFNRNKQKAWDTLDISFEILLNVDFEFFSVFESWVEKAKSDFDSSIILLKEKQYLPSLNKLQLGVEGLIKAYSLYIGLKKEKDLKKEIGHFAVEVYIDLLKKSWVYKARNIFDLQANIDECRRFLESTKIPRVKEENITERDIENLKNELLKWDSTTDFFIENHKKMNRILEKAFSEKDTRLLISIAKRLSNIDIKNYYVAWFSFTTLLLPLSIITQFYQSTYTYPIYTRKLKEVYENSTLVKKIDEVIFLLDKNIETLKKSYPNVQFSYTYLGESLYYKLINIHSIPDDKEKIEVVKKNLEEIKKDVFINHLIKKIKNHYLSTLVEAQLKDYFKIHDNL
jgi:hypothetical protein